MNHDKPDSLDTDLPEKTQLMHLVDALLKNPDTIYQQIEHNDFDRHLAKLLLIFTVCIVFYGSIVGSFSGHIQWFAAPLKIFFGTCLTGILCFPSLYILSCISGVDLRPVQLTGLLISSLALTSILLLGFAPIAFIFTFSIKTLPFMGMIHLAIWCISLYFGLRFLNNGLTKMGSSNDVMIKAWATILLVTLLQMSTSLRPILGESDSLLTAEKMFFLEHWTESLR